MNEGEDAEAPEVAPPTVEEEPDQQVSKEVDHNETKKSLNAVGGSFLGLLQLLSLLANAGLMIYAHVGLSALLESNQRIETDETPTSNATGVCIEADFEIYGQGETKNVDSAYCARDSPNPCFLEVECNTECFMNDFGYSPDCALCFGSQATCALNEGCAFLCAEDYETAECVECSIPCNEIFAECTGLPLPAQNPTSSAPDEVVEDNTEAAVDVCALQKQAVNYTAYEEFYPVYEIKFFSAIETAWYNNAKLLAIIVIVFSGFWPYAKNVALALAWYLPLTPSARLSILTWLRRLGKYTLVDIYVVILILIGVVLETTIGGVAVIVKGEPRLAIISFLVATLWEFCHIEWIYTYHNKVEKQKATEEGNEDAEEEDIIDVWQRGGNSMYQVIMVLLLVTTIGLFVSGSVLEAISFTTADKAISADGCTRSLNLYSLPLEMVSDLVLYKNSAEPGIWTLFMAYMLMAVALPIFVHTIHILIIVFRLQSKVLFELADMSWTFASVEVLLLGIYVLQYKFDEFIAAVAGEEGSEFLTVSAELGIGFFLLIGYSVSSGLLHHYCKHPSGLLKFFEE